MIKWEYQVISILSRDYGPDNKGFRELGELGNEGWELVSVIQQQRAASDLFDSFRLLFFFKKPTPSEDTRPPSPIGRPA